LPDRKVQGLSKQLLAVAARIDSEMAVATLHARVAKAARERLTVSGRASGYCVDHG
jgi:hypothetical protein